MLILAVLNITRFSEPRKSFTENLTDFKHNLFHESVLNETITEPNPHTRLLHTLLLSIQKLIIFYVLFLAAYIVPLVSASSESIGQILIEFDTIREFFIICNISTLRRILLL